MTHDEIKILISAYMDGEVTPSEKNIVQEHLSSCAECQKDYKSYMAISSSLSKWPNESLSPDEELKIQNDLQRRRDPMFNKQTAGILAGALCLVLIVGSVVTVHQRGVQGRLHMASDDMAPYYLNQVGFGSNVSTGNLRSAANDIGDQYTQQPTVHHMVFRHPILPHPIPLEAPMPMGTSMQLASARTGYQETVYDASAIIGPNLRRFYFPPYNLPQPAPVYQYPSPQEGESNTEEYDHFEENNFLGVKDNPLSTFSIDVDTASYSNIRRYLSQGQLPPADAVQIEEMINYFHYDYPQPAWGNPFSVNMEMTPCPWNRTHNLVMIGLQGKKIDNANLPPSNLVLLIDVSGSMSDENKLPLVKSALHLLIEQLRPQDTVSIASFSGGATRVLDPTSGRNKDEIEAVIDDLQVEGSTNGEDGLNLAYAMAKESFKPNGNNRIIVTTDGDFNEGTTNDGQLMQMVEDKRKEDTYLTVLGFGMGNLKASRMEKLADTGNGNYAYIDSMDEARKVLVQQLGGTVDTIAKDVKIQVEFNPAQVKAYRLIGYEKRLLNKEDFNNDKKDAGELGVGQTVTALYEIVPAASSETFNNVDALKYQTPTAPSASTDLSDEVMTVKLRYKDPQSKDDTSKLMQQSIKISQLSSPGSDNIRFAAAVAQFGMLLKNSAYKGTASYLKDIMDAQLATGNDPDGQRAEFFEMVQKAGLLELPIKHASNDQYIREASPVINDRVWHLDGPTQYAPSGYMGISGGFPRTVTAWIRTTQMANMYGKADILSYGGPAYFRFLTVDTYGNWPQAMGRTGLTFDQDYAAITYDAPNLYDGQWHFVAMVIPAGSNLYGIRFYEDGQPLSTVNVSYAPETQVNTSMGDPVTVGGSAKGGYLFQGNISDVSIFNRDLSPAEIDNLYNRTRK